MTIFNGKHKLLISHWENSTVNYKNTNVDSIYSIGAATFSETLSNGFLSNLEVNVSSGYSGVVLNLREDVKLDTLHDYVELEFTLDSFDTASLDTWAFRYGLFDNKGVPAQSDNDPSLNNPEGYIAWHSTSDDIAQGQTGLSGVFRQVDGPSNILGVDNVGGGTSANPGNLPSDIARQGVAVFRQLYNSNAPTELKFRITYNTTSASLAFRGGNTTEQITTRNATRPQELTFNSIAFAFNNNFSLSNLRVHSNK